MAHLIVFSSSSLYYSILLFTRVDLIFALLFLLPRDGEVKLLKTVSSFRFGNSRRSRSTNGADQLSLAHHQHRHQYRHQR